MKRDSDDINLDSINLDNIDLEAHKAWFTNHAAAKIGQATLDPAPLELKLAHTLNVLANAASICAMENLPGPLAKSGLLAALYHDLSRFDQYLQYGTFKDRDSRNHGAWSVKLLKHNHRLAALPPDMRRAVLIAVGMHNRMAVPAAVTGQERIACQIVRDADKLDILRVMAEHLAKKPYNPTVILGLPDDPDRASSAVIAAALAGRSASYADLRSLNDFRLLLGTWLFDMNFDSSRKLFRARGHAREIVAALPETGTYKKARAAILVKLADTA